MTILAEQEIVPPFIISSAALDALGQAQQAVAKETLRRNVRAGLPDQPSMQTGAGLENSVQTRVARMRPDTRIVRPTVLSPQTLTALAKAQETRVSGMPSQLANTDRVLASRLGGELEYGSTRLRAGNSTARRFLIGPAAFASFAKAQEARVNTNMVGYLHQRFLVRSRRNAVRVC